MYELTFITNSGLSEGDLHNLISDIKNAITSRLNGKIIKEFFTKKIALAYPIKKNRQGFLVSVDFDLEKDKIDTLKNIVRESPQILRHLLIIKKLAKAKTIKAKVAKPKTAKPKIPKEKIKTEDLDKRLEEILEA